MNEARHRQSGDDLQGLKRQQQRRKLEKCQDKDKAGGFKAQLLLSAFVFAFLILMIIGTSFNRKIVLETPLPRHGYNKNLITSNDLRTTKLVPSSDKQVLKFLQDSPEILSLKSSGFLRIGLVNFAKPSLAKWKSFGGQKPNLFSIDEQRHFSWSDFFPNEIDRDEEVQNRDCPKLPVPPVPKGLKLDLIVANIPCDESNSRDLDRVRASIAAARIALETGDSNFTFVVGVSDCKLDPNVFRCKELIRQENNVGLYRIDRDRIGKLLSLPFGSCRSVQVQEHQHSGSEIAASRQAYATILHSVKSYVCGAVVLAHSIRKTGSNRDLILIVDEHISPEDKEGLESAGWKIHHIERIRNPRARPSAYNEWNYSKFRLWQLIQYDKVVFIDADVVVTRNIDFLFDLPELSAARNHKSIFNSGVMVIEPANCTFESLVERMSRIVSYNGGDQGYLNEIYTWWHRLPRTVNFLKHFDEDSEENEYKMRLFSADPPELFAMHFLGMKPWVCGRGADCNRNYSSLRSFANDFVHSRWWSWHDAMPESLQRLCEWKTNPRKPPAAPTGSDRVRNDSIIATKARRRSSHRIKS